MKPIDIKTIRTGLNWTQAQLAEKAGVHPKTVADWERQDPSTDSTASAVQRIERAFALVDAGAVCDNPKAALLAVFDKMSADQQAQAAMLVRAVANGSG